MTGTATLIVDGVTIFSDLELTGSGLASHSSVNDPTPLDGTSTMAYNFADTTVPGARSGPLHFLPIEPCRLVDTRIPTASLGGPSLPARTIRTFPLRSACGLPTNATAYSLNVTVVPKGPLGYLSIWPSGQGQPFVSTLNALDGRIKANAAIVPAGTSDGSVNVYVTDATEVIIDVNGVFVPQGSNSAGQAFYAVAPCRIGDTRLSSGGTMAAQVNRSFPVAGVCGVPVTATAYALNVTVVPKTVLGFLTLWRGGVASVRPTVSTLNALTGTVTANMAIVPAGAAGDINAYATNATETIVDVTGYFAAPGSLNALTFRTLTPCRVLDTRNPNSDFGGPLPQALSTRGFNLPLSPCGVPAEAKGYSVNATVVPSAALGFLTLFPTGVTRPIVSTLNASDGSIASNAALLPAGQNGSVSAYFTDRSHLILDINGYFAPFAP